MIELPPHGDRRSRTQGPGGDPAARSDFRRRSSEVEVVGCEVANLEAEEQRCRRQEAIAAYEFIARLG